MKRTIKNHIKIMKGLFLSVKKKPLFIAVPVLIDLVFLLCVGFVGRFVLMKSVPHLEKIAFLNINAPPIPNVVGGDPSAFLAHHAEMMGLLTKVLIIFGEVLFSLFLLWIVFQGINWFLAVKSVEKKANLKKYFLNFLLVSLVGGGLIAFIWYLFFQISLKNAARTIPIVSGFALNVGALFLVAVVAYFVFIGYSLGHKYKGSLLIKNMFQLGVREFKEVILGFAFLIFLFVIANTITKLFGLLGFGAMLVSGVVIIMPLIAFSRIFLVRVVKEI